MIATESAGPRAAAWGDRVRVMRGAFAWFMQRITAALLLVFLGAHFWVLHFAIVGQSVTFGRVADRLHSPWFVLLDSLLLAVAIYHGLNGVRTVIFDFNIRPAAKTWLTAALWIFGVVAAIYGINALLPFMGYAPFIGQ